MKKKSNLNNLIKIKESTPGLRVAIGLIGGALSGLILVGLGGAIFWGIIGGIIGAFIEEDERQQKKLDKWW